jgi:ParB/RepB/Spo0J family partition protein
VTVTASTPAPTEVPQYIPVDLIDPAPTNRDLGTEASLRELAESIKSKGLLQPIIVSPKEAGRFEIVFGHRRLEAVKRADMDTILAVVRDYDEQERRELRLIENVLRKNPTPIEEAAAYQELLDLNPKLNQAKLAKRLGISQGTISRRLKLMALPRRLQDEVNSGRIPAEDAYHLSKLTNHPNGEKLIKNARARAAELGITIEQAVIQVRDDLKNALKREMAKEDLDKRGVKLAPKGWERTGWRLGSEEGMLHIDPYEHQTEPCHAALINDAGQITYVCTDPKRHQQDTSAEAPDGQPTSPDAETTESPEGQPSDAEIAEPSAEQVAPSGAPTEQSKTDQGDPKAEAERQARAEAERKAKAEAERKAAEERARAETLRNARQARRDALRTALKAKLTKDMERYIYTQVLNAVQLDHDAIARELLDLPATKGSDDSPLRAFASKSDERLKKVAFALLAMMAEHPLQAPNPNFEHKMVATHYEFLARIGYTPTEVEATALGQDQQAQAPADVA